MKCVRNLLISLYLNILLVILLIYLMLVALSKETVGGWVLLFVLCITFFTSGLSILFGVFSTIRTYKFYSKNDYNSLRKNMKVLKFGLIPYFILNFITYLLIFFVLLMGSRGMVIFSPILAFFIGIISFTYLAVVLTSSYGIGYLILLKKENKIKTKGFIIHVLLQLCFVLDVVDTIIILVKYRTKRPDQNVSASF